MKNLFVFLTVALLHANYLSAQTNPTNANPIRVELGADFGSQTHSFKKVATDKLPGELDFYNSRSLGLHTNLVFSKRFSLTARYMNESGRVQKTVDRKEASPGWFLVDLFVSAATQTTPSFDHLSYDPGYTYSAKTNLNHIQFMGNYNWVTKPKFCLFSGLGLGFASGKAHFTQKDGQKISKKISADPNIAFVPFGLGFGGKVRFDMAFGLGSAPYASASLGMQF